MKNKKIIKFCKFCGKKLMANDRDGNLGTGVIATENLEFDEFTGERKDPRWKFQITLYCPTWETYWKMIPRTGTNQPHTYMPNVEVWEDFKV